MEMRSDSKETAGEGAGRHTRGARAPEAMKSVVLGGDLGNDNGSCFFGNLCYAQERR